MAEASDAIGMFRQNLIDAGCSQELVARCMKLTEAHNEAQILRILARHRKTLLDTVHMGQKQIDCLDYLVYQMGKTQSRKN